MNEVKEKIRQFLSRFFYSNDIQDDDNILEMDTVNSLFTMQLLMFLESEFKFQVSNEDIDLENFKSINAIVNYLRKKGVS
ncbi:Acyl carrier protein [Clostridium cavendishii DSM 21758]|uniref:Acyl carrier protein n=1 Tax=Clostridium cavendishii DSM 21758 TaxID=1121302 RepID=A0A1M6MRZ4_9CLOT|nr:acyl carrier protein [Clostridium cavendishii]SHJ86278.1 Acyl carrier protein [Clostridium cavendishii DSM 21758]